MKGSSKKEKTLIIVGSSLILIGVLCNARILGILFSPDGYIESVQRRMVILVFEAFFILMGFLFIKDRIYIRGRKIIFSITTFILFLFVMEGCIRIFCLVENKIIPRASGFSKYLGWETGANVSLKRKSRAYGEIKYSTKKWGFRVFGNINSAKTKIFVIGDSITMGFCVSDGNTYYDYLKKNNNNIDLFAYGGAGYGTLQEYMILDKYFDIIKPDMVLWQFSSNDIINNSYELECASFSNNNHMVRPYYRNGQIEWLYPKQNIGWINEIRQSSYLLRLINIRLNIFWAEKFGTVEDELSETHPLFKKSVATTSEIMGLVRKRIGSTQMVAFSFDKPKWLGDTFSDICSKYNINYVYGVPEAVKRAKESGIVVDGFPYDLHWNDVGHSIAGETILNHLIEAKLLDVK